ncbi:MAG TPA: YjbH domain-containing protein [Bacteroidales bacterium]
MYVLIFLVSSLFAQDSSELLKEKLENIGFENIRISAENNNYTISFENNVYRWNVRALSTALDTISSYAPKNASLNVIQLKLDIPQIVTKVDGEKWLKFRSDTIYNSLIDSSLMVSFKTQTEWNKVKHTKPLNRNTAKFDLVFYPQFYLVNLRFSKIYEVQFNIAPALEFSLWKGSLFTAQVIFPIYSDCKAYGEEGKKIRPGFLVLSQNFRFDGPWFGNVSVGNFNYHRYGIDFTMSHPFKNPRWDIEFNAGLTGSSVFTNDGWELGELNTVTFFAGAGYYLPRFNLRFDAKVGRFIQGDYGGRFDLTRMFGETSIGFYAAYTTTDIDGEGNPNAGFHFSIPFPPGKRFKPKTFKVDIPGYFDWEYNGATDFVYNRYYEVRPNENHSEYYFNPIYIKEELMLNRHYK